MATAPPVGMERAVVTPATRGLAIAAVYFRQSESPQRISIGKSTLCSIGDTGTEPAAPKRIWHD
jgi:hypothetical protein